MIYLDNSATTPLCEAAKNKIIQMTEVFGNPSSLHSEGLKAEKELTLAREIIAGSFGARADEVFFTSSGTESDNIAILGAARKNAKVGKKIITTDSEHPAVARTLDFLETEGWQVIRLSTKGGSIDMAELEASLSPDIALVSVMRTNNETGAVYDVAAVSKAVKRVSPRAIVHSDCVQAYMKEKLTLPALGADMISVSAHKVHAPKGVGVLVLKKGLVIPPHTYGGGQEKGLRSGTENTISIAAMGAAVEELTAMKERIGYLSELREYTVNTLGAIDGVKLNLPEKACISVVNISVPGFRSEVLLHKLSSDGIFVSSGSACSAKKGKSGVLEAFGLSDKEADGALRISLSHYNTKSEVDTLAESLNNAMKTIAKVR
ncbi:MAG: cysteine desulfurase [Ruminococcaceae bacterium]|nr:cysteine desulfurase [Oscillospiraceae bacterium]